MTNAVMRPGDPEGHTDPRVGQLVSGRYRIRELLGTGGMGAVYLAEHTHMRKRVALKLLRPEMSSNAEALARFEREALAAAHIEHPNVVAATDFGKTEDGAFFLVLEYVEGTSLRHLLDARLPTMRALHIARQIALALDRAHDAGIVHRDLKPENVMLVRREDDPDFVKVLDFGIAKVPVGTIAPTEGTAPQVLTKMGEVIGTPEYMSPEQSVGEAVGPGTDLYALGIMMYEMLTGKHPFDPPNRMMVLTMHVLEPVPPMNVRAPDATVPEAVEAVVRKLLEKEVKSRYLKASEVVQAIDEAALEMRRSQRRIELPPPPPPQAPMTAASVATTAATAASAAASVAIASARAIVREVDAKARETFPIVLERVKAAPRPLMLALGIALPAFVALVVLVIVLIVTHKSAEEEGADGATTLASGTPADSVSAPPESPPKPARATREQIEGAARNPEALQELAGEFPEDPAVAKELAFAYHDNGKADLALASIRRQLELDPTVDPVVLVIVVKYAVRGTGKTADDAFALLEGPLGAQGVDALYEMTRARQLPLRQRATKSLEKPDVRGNASPQVAVLLELKDASSCQAKHDLMERIAQDGDVRILPALKSLKSTSGCGFLDLGDCWPCLRYDRALDDAIAAVSGRGK